MSGFRTTIIPPPLDKRIAYDDPLLLMGSCFTEHIGDQLQRYRFQTIQNPFGIVYNPASMALGLSRLIREEYYTAADLLQYNDLWLSFDHHSRFSSPDRSICLDLINRELESASRFIRNASYLILSFGTARVYRLSKTGRIVTNCHKLPADCFEEEHLTVEDVTQAMQKVISDARKINPDLQIILSVSPVRYWKYGAVGNQVSKSTLLLACHYLSQQLEGLEYFPAYEMFMDDLRDYRFYDIDMLHPGAAGISYVWDRFTESCLHESVRPVMKVIEKVIKASGHRSTGYKTPARKEFLTQTMALIKDLQVRFPHMDFTQESQLFGSELTAYDSD